VRKETTNRQRKITAVLGYLLVCSISDTEINGTISKASGLNEVFEKI